MEYIVKTDVGVVRSENQDKAAIFENGDFVLAVLCDGMGGHAGGSHASRITAEQFKKEFSKSFPKKEELYAEWFTQVLKKAKKSMQKFASKNYLLLDMGTTVTCAVIAPTAIFVFNVGDSRTYVYNGLLHQITRDHNLRNHYIDKFKYTEEEAATVMGAAALTSALGPKKKTNIESFKVDWKDDDVRSVVLTSDGIHDYVVKPIFEKIIGSDAPLEKKASVLIRQAIKGKSSDNLTVVIVEVV